MNQDSTQKNPKIQSKKVTPASHGDELDVLEAVRFLEKKQSKKILTTKQKMTLLEGRNLGLGMSDEEKMQTSFETTKLILSYMSEYDEDLYTKDEWDGFGKDQKLEAGVAVFNRLFGITPDQFGYRIYKRLGGVK